MSIINKCDNCGCRSADIRAAKGCPMKQKGPCIDLGLDAGKYGGYVTEEARRDEAPSRWRDFELRLARGGPWHVPLIVVAAVLLTSLAWHLVAR